MGCGQIPEGTEHGSQVPHELGVSRGFREGEKQDEQDEDTAGHGEALFLLHRNLFEEATEQLPAGDGYKHLKAQILQNPEHLGGG